MECTICSEEITAATGRTVLGCGHEFHMVCVARWFCRQEGASSCPCCRRESGAYDDVPRAAAGDDSDSEWSDEEEDDASVVSVEIFWQRNATGTWKQMFRETATTNVWDPVREPDDVPEDITEGAVSLQRMWRGYWVRRGLVMREAAEALLALKAGAGAEPTSVA